MKRDAVSVELPPSPKEVWGPTALDERRSRTRDLLARLASRRDYWIDHNRYYYRLLARLLQFLVEPGKRVLSVRCGTGTLLAAARPSLGRGIDICREMIDVARRRHPEFQYDIALPDTDSFRDCFEESEKFDYIAFSEIDDTVDVQCALQNLKPLCERHTRLLVTTYNPLWEPLVTLAEKLGMKVPRVEQNWLSGADVRNLLTLSGFQPVSYTHLTLPTT